MKHPLTILLIGLAIIVSCEDKNVEEPPIIFVNTFGGSSYDVGYSVQQTTDGGYIVAGRTSSFGNGETDAWLIKTDSEGNTVEYGD